MGLIERLQLLSEALGPILLGRGRSLARPGWRPTAAGLADIDRQATLDHLSRSRSCRLGVLCIGRLPGEA